MSKILITANAKNRAKVFIPIADKLAEMGMQITFVSLDSILDQDASPALKQSRHTYIELPAAPDTNLFKAGRKERFKMLKETVPAVRDLLKTINPSVVILGAASYVEDIFIEEAKRRGIKTVLMQDGLRIEQDTNFIEKAKTCIISKISAIANEWTRGLHGVSYFFSPFGTNRVDKILLFGNGVREQFIRQGIYRDKLAVVGNPMYDSAAPLPHGYADKIRGFLGISPDKPVLLFGMQCFCMHDVLSLDNEIELVKNLVDLFRDLTNVDLIIKLHPDNDYEMYRSKFIEWNPSENVHLAKDEFTPYEFLGIASAFMTVYSTMALESLVHNVPVITLDYTKVNYRLNLEPAALAVRSSESLASLLKKADWADELTAKVKSHRDEILDRELVNLGFAAENAADEIAKLFPH